MNDKSGISIEIIFRKFGFQSPEMSKVHDLYYVGSVFKVVFSEKLLEYPFYSKNAQFLTTFFEKVGADYEQLFVVFFSCYQGQKNILLKNTLGSALKSCIK